MFLGRIPESGHRSILLRKEIPVAAGLAGGSADAAAALVAFDQLYRTQLTQEELLGLGAKLGSDVPFLLVGGVAIGSGRGEKLAPVPTGFPSHWVVAAAHGQLSTPEVYSELDRLRSLGLLSKTMTPMPSVFTQQVSPTLEHFSRALRNDLHPAAVSLRQNLAPALRTGRRAGALASISLRLRSYHAVSRSRCKPWRGDCAGIVGASRDLSVGAVSTKRGGWSQRPQLNA